MVLGDPSIKFLKKDFLTVLSTVSSQVAAAKKQQGKQEVLQKMTHDAPTDDAELPDVYFFYNMVSFLPCNNLEHRKELL